MQENQPSNIPVKKSRRPIIFIAVGIFNTLADFLVFTLITQTILKQNIALAGFLSGTIALLMAYVTHSKVTWRERSMSRISIIKFFAVTGFGMWAIRPILLLIFSRMVMVFDFSHKILSSFGLPLSYSFIANSISFCLMVFVVLIYNYLSYDRFVFNETKKD